MKPPKILVIDDGPVMRILAESETHEFSKHVSVPERPSELYELDLSDVDLVFLDRHLSNDWRLAVDVILKRLPTSARVIEWTADTSSKQETPASEKLDKSLGSLQQRVEQWAKEYGIRSSAMFAIGKLLHLVK